MQRLPLLCKDRWHALAMCQPIGACSLLAFVARADALDAVLLLLLLPALHHLLRPG
jgi:hypothetical protein